MKAIILAAGFSTRLYPLTLNFPKGLLEINHKAICSYVLDELIKLPQITEIALITNHLYYPHFAEWLKNNYSQNNIKLIDNKVENLEHRLGAIGDLQFSLDKLKWADDIFVAASDTLISIDFNKLMEFFTNHKGFITVLFDTHDKEIIKNTLSSVVIDKHDRVLECVEKPDHPKTSLVAIPYYIYPKECLKLVKTYTTEDHPKDAPGFIVPWLIGKIPVYGFKVEGYYFDVGTKEILEKLQKDFHISGGV